MGGSQTKELKVTSKQIEQQSTQKQPRALIRLEPTEISEIAWDENYYKSEQKYGQQLTRKSTMVGNLAVSPGKKINHSLTKEEKEIQKMQHILDLERQRAENNRRKFETKEEEIARK